MKFFLDENIQQRLTSDLNSIFKSHEFIGIADLDAKGSPDTQLFPTVASAGVDAIITADLRQLTRPGEREACRSANLHWIGVHQVHAGGFHSLAGLASVVIHGLPFVFDAVRRAPGTPQYFKLKKFERNYTKVFHSSGDL